MHLLGVFPPTWREMTLAEVCTQVTDGTHDSPKPVDVGGFPLVTGKAIKNREIDFSVTYKISLEDHLRVISRSKSERNDILFANIGNSIGDLVRVQSDIEFSIKNVALFKPDTSLVNPIFLEYYLLSDVVQNFVKGSTKGSAQPFLGLGSLRTFPVAVPSMEEQEWIAGILGVLDDRIRLLRETNTTLESIAQALFKSWFVDFDPVRAKQEGREPESMDADTAALFTGTLEKSELGMLPSGWQVSSVGDVVECVGGGTPNTKNPSFWEPAEFAWTTPKDLSGSQSPVLLKTERMMSASGISNISSGLLPKGTLLLSSRAPIGYLAIAQIRMAINQGYIAMLPGGPVPPLYLLFWCRQNMETIKSRANGSTFMEISKKAFRPIPIVIPPAQILSRYMDVAGALFERLVENERQAQTLMALRDSLMPRLISGHLRLSEAGALIEEAAAKQAAS